MSQIFISKHNTTTASLGANTAFTGSMDILTSFEELDINIAGSPAVAPGTVTFEFSPDGTNWDISVALPVAGPNIVPIPLRTILPYFRVKYGNGGVPLSQFRLTTTLHRNSSAPLTRFLSQPLDVNEPVLVVRTAGTGSVQITNVVTVTGTLSQVPVGTQTVTGSISVVGTTITGSTADGRAIVVGGTDSLGVLRGARVDPTGSFQVVVINQAPPGSSSGGTVQYATGSTSGNQAVLIAGTDAVGTLRAPSVDLTGSFKVVVVNPNPPGSSGGGTTQYTTGSTSGNQAVLMGGTDALGVIRAPFVDATGSFKTVIVNVPTVQLITGSVGIGGPITAQIQGTVSVTGSVAVVGSAITGSTSDGRALPISGIDSAGILRAPRVDSTGSFQVVVINPSPPGSSSGGTTQYTTGSTSGNQAVLIGGTDLLGVIRAPFVDSTGSFRTVVVNTPVVQQVTGSVGIGGPISAQIQGVVITTGSISVVGTAVTGSTGDGRALSIGGNDASGVLRGARVDSTGSFQVVVINPTPPVAAGSGGTVQYATGSTSGNQAVLMGGTDTLGVIRAPSVDLTGSFRVIVVNPSPIQLITGSVGIGGPVSVQIQGTQTITGTVAIVGTAVTGSTSDGRFIPFGGADATGVFRGARVDSTGSFQVVVVNTPPVQVITGSVGIGGPLSVQVLGVQTITGSVSVVGLAITGSTGDGRSLVVAGTDPSGIVRGIRVDATGSQQVTLTNVPYVTGTVGISGQISALVTGTVLAVGAAVTGSTADGRAVVIAGADSLGVVRGARVDSTGSFQVVVINPSPPGSSSGGITQYATGSTSGNQAVLIAGTDVLGVARAPRVDPTGSFQVVVVNTPPALQTITGSVGIGGPVTAQIQGIVAITGSVSVVGAAVTGSTADGRVLPIGGKDSNNILRGAVVDSTGSFQVVVINPAPPGSSSGGTTQYTTGSTPGNQAVLIAGTDSIGTLRAPAVDLTGSFKVVVVNPSPPGAAGSTVQYATGSTSGNQAVLMGGTDLLGVIRAPFIDATGSFRTVIVNVPPIQLVTGSVGIGGPITAQIQGTVPVTGSVAVVGSAITGSTSDGRALPIAGIDSAGVLRSPRVDATGSFQVVVINQPPPGSTSSTVQYATGSTSGGQAVLIGGTDVLGVIRAPLVDVNRSMQITGSVSVVGAAVTGSTADGRAVAVGGFDTTGILRGARVDSTGSMQVIVANHPAIQTTLVQNIVTITGSIAAVGSAVTGSTSDGRALPIAGIDSVGVLRAPRVDTTGSFQVVLINTPPVQQITGSVGIGGPLTTLIQNVVTVTGSVSVVGTAVTGSTIDGRVVPVGGRDANNLVRGAIVDTTGSFQVVVINQPPPGSSGGTTQYATGSTSGGQAVLIGGTDSLGVLRAPFVDSNRSMQVTGSVSVVGAAVTGSTADGRAVAIGGYDVAGILRGARIDATGSLQVIAVNHPPVQTITGSVGIGGPLTTLIQNVVTVTGSVAVVGSAITGSTSDGRSLPIAGIDVNGIVRSPRVDNTGSFQVVVINPSPLQLVTGSVGIGGPVTAQIQGTVTVTGSISAVGVAVTGSTIDGRVLPIGGRDATNILRGAAVDTTGSFQVVVINQPPAGSSGGTTQYATGSTSGGQAVLIGGTDVLGVIRAPAVDSNRALQITGSVGIGGPLTTLIQNVVIVTGSISAVGAAVTGSTADGRAVAVGGFDTSGILRGMRVDPTGSLQVIVVNNPPVQTITGSVGIGGPLTTLIQNVVTVTGSISAVGVAVTGSTTDGRVLPIGVVDINNVLRVGRSDVSGNFSMVITSPSASAQGIYATINPYGRLRVSNEAGVLFFDPFDGTSIDTNNRWNAVGTAGGATVIQSTGTLLLNMTTTANASASITSQMSASNYGTSFLVFESSLQFEQTSSFVQNTSRFWGTGVTGSNPTAALPLSDAIGFEIDTAGSMNCVVYGAGVRRFSAAIPAPRVPLDGAFHRYRFYTRTDVIYWFIDNIEAPVATANFVLPDKQQLPIRFHSMNGPIGPGVATKTVVSAIGVSDTGGNSYSLGDGIYPWRKATVHASGSLQVMLSDNGTGSFIATVVSASRALRVANVGTRLVQGGFRTTTGLLTGAATAQNLLSIEATGGVNVYIKTLEIQSSLTSSSPARFLYHVGRTTAVSAGGTTVTAQKRRNTDATQTAILRFSPGTATTSSLDMWTATSGMVQTNVGLMSPVLFNVFPATGDESDQVILSSGEALLVRVDGNSLMTGHVVNITWQEGVG